MDRKFGLLVPQRAYVNHRSGRSGTAPRLIGRLPEDAYILLFVQLPLADAVNLARSCRKVAALSADERVWTRKLAILKYSGPTPEAAQRLLDAIEDKKRLLQEQLQAQAAAQSVHHSSSGSIQELEEKRRSDLNASPLTFSRTPSKLHRQSMSQDSYPTLTMPNKTNPTSINDTNSSFGIGEEEEEDFGDFSTAATTSAPASGKNHESGLTVFSNIAFDDAASAAPKTAVLLPTANANAKHSLRAPVQPKVKRKEDDLLMLFDDDEMEDIGMATVSPTKVAIPAMLMATPTKSALNRSASINGIPMLGSPSISSPANMVHKASPAPTRDLFKAYYTALIPYYLSMQSHTTNSLVFSHPTLTPLARAQLLSTLTRLTNSESIAPTRKIATLSIVRRNLQSSTDYFEASTLAQFERAANGNLQRDMRETTAALFELNGGYSVLQVYINKIPLFYDQSWDPLKNLTKTFGPGGDLIDGIDFSAMDAFMAHVLAIVEREGTVIARVFPPDTDVLVTFADRIANDVLSDYIISLLSAAQDLEAPLFLLTTAACFGQAMRLVDTIVEVRPPSKIVTRSSVEKVILRMYEQHMDAYLKEELQWARTMLANICEEWDRKMTDQALRDDPQFLASQNVQQVKRNILAGFTKALLLPVTIVPKTVAFGVNALTYGGSMALSAVSGGLVGGNSTPKPITTALAVAAADDTVNANGSIKSPPLTASSSFAASGGRGFGMLLSLDTAMQLIQADRDCLKRIQTFAGYSGIFGTRVKSTIEDVFIILCQTLGEHHLKPAFTKAIAQMDAYRPAEHGVDESVTPLVQFFELVHIGDTIAQMLQVYYDRELTGYVDKNDFLSMVVREKKRFENTLDDAVAAGLNSGVSILMEQAEHILRTQQDIRDFAPELPSSSGMANGHKAEFDVTDIDGPSNAAQAVVECLKSHCDMLKGSTDKAILDVFHQEVGLRLHGILLKHLKRSIVSIPGGFQVIADLNLYTSFVSSLKLPAVNPYFVALKMAGNVFIIDSPRDLGLMARDLDRYEGTLRIEDIMEMVQCRTDWKKIERLVEKEVFGFKAEDCIVM